MVFIAEDFVTHTVPIPGDLLSLHVDQVLTSMRPPLLAFTVANNPPDGAAFPLRLVPIPSHEQRHAFKNHIKKFNNNVHQGLKGREQPGGGRNKAGQDGNAGLH